MAASACAILLRLLAEPSHVAGLSESDWDAVIRLGGPGRLLGTLRSRLEAAGILAAVPPQPRRRLESDYMLARFQGHTARYQLGVLADVLAPLGIPLVALKGAAYRLQGLRCADGRFTSDVDLMVPRRHLEAAEARLKEAGWAFKELDPYDERYYRTWAHELPPMRSSGHYLELDLHHTILPLTGRIQPDADALFAASVPTQHTVIRVLCPADQVLHACAHLAQDSDFVERLRDVVDVDALVREFSDLRGFWDALLERAVLHGLQRPLWYALRYSIRWLGTPVPGQAQSRMQRWAPSGVVRSAMDWLVPRSALPDDPDRGAPVGARFARTALLIRSHWLRMPPGLLLRHLLEKGVRRWMPRRAVPSGGGPSP